MTDLTLNLLGRFEVFDDPSSQPINFPRRKAAALLAYLAMPAGRKKSREEIADLFWGYTGDSGARNSLRQTLLVIRRVLPNFRGLESTPHSLLLLPSHVSTDVSEFERNAGEGTLTALERAAKIYSGDFLGGFDVREDPFERWKTQEVARLRDIGLSVFERLMFEYMRLDRHAYAIQIAIRSLAVDPLHEVAHQTLMKSYAALGRNGLASRQYGDFRKSLELELGVKPNAETERVYALVSREPNGALRSAEKFISAPPIIPNISTGPVVAVLPFEYAGTNSEALSGSLTSKLIAVLAKTLPLTIVDHHSISAAVARNTQTADLANLFGARYAVEGSIRYWNKCWRADFGLVDVPTKRHLCSGSCELEDTGLFRLVDQIAMRIVAKIAFQIEATERSRAAIGASGSLGSWEKLNRGMALLDRMSHADIIPAQHCIVDAIAMEPNNARSLAGLSQAVLQEGLCLVGRDRSETHPESLDLALRAYALDRNDPFINWTLGKSYQRAECFSLALDSFRRALKISPENPEICATTGNLLAFMGRPEEGLPMLVSSFSSTDIYLVNVGRCYLQMGNYEKAREWSERTIRLQPNNSWAYVVMGSALGHLDRPDEALSVLQQCESIHPGRVDAEFSVQPTQYANPNVQDHILDGLQVAGWQP